MARRLFSKQSNYPNVDKRGPTKGDVTNDFKNIFKMFTYIPCILIIIKVFFSPTDAQLDNLKNNFKFALKLTSKDSYMFRCEKRHPQGAHYLILAKVTVVKMS